MHPSPTPTPHPARPLRRALATLLGLVLLTLLGAPASAQTDPEAQQILDAIIDNLRGGEVTATLVMTVTRGDRVDEYRLETFSEGDQRSLVQVVAPPRDAGQAFLNVEDTLFIYNPRLRRTLRLPPSGRSDSFLGSDLSFNDLAGDDYRDDYSATVSARDDTRITLELIPGPQAPTPYGKLLFSADATTYAPMELIFYDQREQQVKRIDFSEVVEADGRFIPTRFEVRDLLRDDSSTVAVWESYDFEAEIPDACFTPQALERGCRLP